MRNFKRLISTIPLMCISLYPLSAETFEPIKYGDFESWVTRELKESAIIGGNKKILYAIGPNETITGNTAYSPKGGSPWASSNVYAHVMGITKGSNAVYPEKRSTGGQCARLSCIMEKCKAIGIINIDVCVAGSIFLGKMTEPVKSTKDPYSKLEMGVPFTKRPSALRFDYNLQLPANNDRTYSSGFGKKKTYPGHDSAEVFILLQRRWEDADGNIHAKRVGTGRQLFSNDTKGWVNKYDLPIYYGDITQKSFYKPYMGLIDAEKSYYARNSKGKMVPVIEEGWDTSDATPTHMLMMASAGSGTAYIGTVGLNFLIDNMGLVYK